MPLSGYVTTPQSQYAQLPNLMQQLPQLGGNYNTSYQTPTARAPTMSYTGYPQPAQTAQSSGFNAQQYAKNAQQNIINQWMQQAQAPQQARQVQASPYQQYQQQAVQQMMQNPDFLSGSGPTLPGRSKPNLTQMAFKTLTQGGLGNVLPQSTAQELRNVFMGGLSDWTVGGQKLPGGFTGESAGALNKYSQLTGVPLSDIEASLDPNWYGWRQLYPQANQFSPTVRAYYPSGGYSTMTMNEAMQGGLSLNPPQAQQSYGGGGGGAYPGMFSQPAAPTPITPTTGMSINPQAQSAMNARQGGWADKWKELTGSDWGSAQSRQSAVAPGWQELFG